MKFFRSGKWSPSHTAVFLAACIAVVSVVGAVPSFSQSEPILHLRADSNIESDEGGVTAWKSIVGGAEAMTFDVGNLASRPVVNPTGINDQPSISLAAGRFFRGPDGFPVNSDYVLYVVMSWSGAAGSNNLFSGTSRACYLGSTPYPKVLHSGNFGQQSISSVAVDGPTIVRVEYTVQKSEASIWINNELGSRAGVPPNIDPTMLIGAYGQGNFFTGEISEIVVFDNRLTGEERWHWDSTLHERYGINREPDPVPPPFTTIHATQALELVPRGEDISVAIHAIADSVGTVVVEIDSAGIRVADALVSKPSQGWGTDTVSVSHPATVGLHTYSLRLGVLYGGEQGDTILNNENIVCGEVIAIEGQSNSIFNDASLGANEFARTFGSNFGKSLTDTVFKRSIATGNGGGPNVGGWGLFLQNAFAEELAIPTCVINGGVGGTRIESHMPDPQNRTNLNTIYGSWLYRLEKSGLKDHITWLFWYQGESNAGADDYYTLFGQLRDEWHKDLPNLEHIVVVQIRPGCGGAEHALLRDDIRRLDAAYDDVTVHTACALPGHDGCHFTSAGYRTLGSQLFNIMKDTREAPSQESQYLAPRVQFAGIDPSLGTVAITFDRAQSIKELSADGRFLTEAFFFNGDETLQPDSAWIKGTTVVLRIPAESSVTMIDVSYVPSKQYPGTNITYAGPWIVDEVGVGALSFFRIPLTVTSVNEYDEPAEAASMIVHRGETFTVNLDIEGASLVSLDGVETPLEVALESARSIKLPNSSSFGVFLLKTWGFGRKTAQKVLIIP